MTLTINIYNDAITITRRINNIERPIFAINNIESYEITKIIKEKKEKYKNFVINIIYHDNI
jgi:hypothetical protein